MAASAEGSTDGANPAAEHAASSAARSTSPTSARTSTVACWAIAPKLTPISESGGSESVALAGDGAIAGLDLELGRGDERDRAIFVGSEDAQLASDLFGEVFWLPVEGCDIGLDVLRHVGAH